MNKSSDSSMQWWPFIGLMFGLSAGALAFPSYSGWSTGGLGLLGLAVGYLLVGLHKRKQR